MDFSGTFGAAVMREYYNPPDRCRVCGLFKPRWFRKARSVAIYDGVLKDMLIEFKFAGNLTLQAGLCNVMIENMSKDLSHSPDVVVPVPLHKKKLLDREFNQSVVLAGAVACRLRAPMDPFSLKRLRFTRPQFELPSALEKYKNVEGAFGVVNSNAFKGKAVLLVDDIITTGSTAAECAKALRAAGAGSVEVLTLMRALGE
ncbi:MAG: ComF family protein [Candidatus Dadabacteria bacterium]|nr:ComF family protein [Candidatus Dadabacteria bacterium]